MRRIPQTDPRAGYEAHRDEIDEAVRRAFDNGRYILGPDVTAFEEEFGRFVGDSRAIGVANGTDALELALRACGISAGDGVVTVSHTAVATVAAIRRCGGRPVFADIDPDTYTLSGVSLAEALERARGSGLRVTAVVVVHLYGAMAPMPEIIKLAESHGLRVIEDCAQAHGAALNGIPAGSWGHAAAFSFYPTKNLGALGDGGAVVTRDAAVADRVRELRQYGWRERYVSAIEGFNSRLDEVQAAVLRVKLRYLTVENAARIRLAALYTSGLSAGVESRPRVALGARHVFHQYVIRIPNRERFRATLAERGIDTAIHYPQAVHQQPAYRALDPTARLQATEAIMPGILSLPMYPQLTAEDARRVIEAANASLAVT